MIYRNHKNGDNSRDGGKTVNMALCSNYNQNSYRAYQNDCVNGTTKFIYKCTAMQISTRAIYQDLLDFQDRHVFQEFQMILDLPV